ncbi:MAG: CsbD family protein [Bdellovibrionota bacterium]
MDSNKNQIKGNWDELKGKIKQAWGKLTDDDVTTAKGNLDEISGRVQKAYGYTQERAQEELTKFKRKHNL